MKITILYDNTAWDSRLTADWGFSCLVEAHGKKICPTHCTQHIREIAAWYPDQYIPGGAGKTILRSASWENV
ncbi:MAG: hypothetical protein WA081_14985 [Desulfosalsimonadaceae bacterium]